MVEIVKALNPNSPTLYRVVLPKGAELAKAVGRSGFRGFSRTGGKTAHAVLKPVAAGGAIAAGWPVFAVAATVMAVDMAAQREVRAHQRRVEDILGRQEERHYIQRNADQRSADAQLTRAISLMLDGQSPSLELALKSAYDEFHRSQPFLEQHRGTIESLADSDGKVNYRRLEEVLGDESNDHDFFRDLHMARTAIAIQRKALVADAAASALADPDNPYMALRKFLDSQAHQLEEAESAAAAITNQLTGIELKGGWSIPKALAKQERLRRRAAPPTVDDDVEIRFLRTASGEIVQVISIEDEDEEARQLTPTE
ncbi:erythromycin esterase family protein [Aeromicrobium duanguangcaii]|uniref:erythromycin esterase family protein n=1 Tax=Aeromicrobium duanguangcaii TaxID=2968086 RepID=UPI002017FA5B|nr:erythromycin esterase family protein [Aeromicrobium duanguangcaii]MCL3836892.1 erythromycin esterase family protein [Aeromicrobium duanguangcaii]